MTQTSLMEGFATRRFADVGEARVCYRTAGSGPALVLLPGFPLSGMTWRNVVRPLLPHFTCYSFDLIGLGDSRSTSHRDHSSPGQGKVMQQALAQLGVTSYALTGNDTGGWIARELALLDADKVTHLALTNTEIPHHRPPWIPVYQFLARLPGTSPVMRRLLESPRFRRSPLGFGGCFLNHYLIEGEFAHEFVAPIVASPERMDGLLRFLIEMRFRRIDRFANLHGKLTMPAAFLWGEDDPTFPLGLAREMSQQFPNVAHFRTVPGGKLFIQEEYPDAVADWLLEFVGGQAAAS